MPVSFPSLQRELKGSPETVAVPDMSDTLADCVTAQTEGEIKEEDEAMAASEALEPVISRDNPVVIEDNAVPKKEEPDFGENNNNEPAEPNQVSWRIFRLSVGC
ncbi:hypothetical protein TNIN_444871 [Trichonephila inaurata madagascariensis]|uniref:Uncharacterized protein n=1 Tax=Trichonephila inaurata madagascariensis TaxID=2747483 RepID=A0A8X7CTH0_9ARAC|nr:hypothetical protein TNIN_444871 [Trichonephila inaurata madagascariensis]